MLKPSALTPTPAAIALLPEQAVLINTAHLNSAMARAKKPVMRLRERTHKKDLATNLGNAPKSFELTKETRITSASLQGTRPENLDRTLIFPVDLTRTYFWEMENRAQLLANVIYRIGCEQALTEKSGSTLCCVLLIGNRLTVANVGDSHAVLIQGNDNYYFQSQHLTVMHDCDNQEERDRISKAGGTFPKGYFNGKLQYTRSIGDHEVGPQLIFEPDVATMTLNHGAHSHSYVVLASDGFWNVMSIGDLEIFMATQLPLLSDQAPQERANQLAHLLVRQAFLRGSTDNITVTIIATTPQPLAENKAIIAVLCDGHSTAAVADYIIDHFPIYIRDEIKKSEQHLLRLKPLTRIELYPHAHTSSASSSGTQPVDAMHPHTSVAQATGVGGTQSRAAKRKILAASELTPSPDDLPPLQDVPPLTRFPSITAYQNPSLVEDYPLVNNMQLPKGSQEETAAPIKLSLTPSPDDLPVALEQKSLSASDAHAFKLLTPRSAQINPSVNSQCPDSKKSKPNTPVVRK